MIAAHTHESISQDYYPGTYKAIYGRADGNDHLLIKCPCGECVELIQLSLADLGDHFSWPPDSANPILDEVPFTCDNGHQYLLSTDTITEVT